MMVELLSRPETIIDPEPIRETYEQCEINVNKFISDEKFRNIILSEIKNNFEIDSSSIQYYKIIKPSIVKFPIALIKIKNVSTKEKEYIKKSMDGSLLGAAVCIPIEKGFCPLILQYDDSNSTIDHEAIHIYQHLKESYYPFDHQLTNIDRKFVKPSLVVRYILNTLGREKAIEFAVKKPIIILREEAEAWWKVDKNEGVDPINYIISNCLMSLSKFVCPVIDDIKISSMDNQIDELIMIVSEYIEFIGRKEYYCSRIVGALNRRFKKNYSLGRWLTENAEVMLKQNFGSLEQVIKDMCYSQDHDNLSPADIKHIVASSSHPKPS